MLLQYFGSIFWFLAYFSHCIGSIDLKLPGVYFLGFGLYGDIGSLCVNRKKEIGSFWQKTFFSFWPISGSFFSAIA